MAHDRNLGIEDGLDNLNPLFPAFELYGFGSTLPDQPPGIAHRIVGSGVKAQPRHVDHDQGRRIGPLNSSRVENHLIEAHPESRRHPVHHVGRRIADQNDVHLGAVGNHRRRIVVRRDHRDLLTAFALSDLGCRDLCGHEGMVIGIGIGVLSRLTTQDTNIS